MRFTLQAWWCGRCHTRNFAGNKRCLACHSPRIEKHAQIHASERAVVYYNPLTGEHRTPARADLPIPEVYAKQGFERKEIENMSAWERQTGLIHESTSFNSGNEPIEPPTPQVNVSPEVKQDLIDDMRAAIASGPWTGGLPGDSRSS